MLDPKAREARHRRVYDEQHRIWREAQDRKVDNLKNQVRQVTEKQKELEARKEALEQQLNTAMKETFRTFQEFQETALSQSQRDSKAPQPSAT